MDNVTIETAVSIFLGILAPSIISILKDRDWSDTVKIWLTFGVCFIFGALSIFLTSPEELNFEDASRSVGLVFTSAVIFYKAYFERTPLNKQLTETKIITPTSEETAEEPKNDETGA